MNLFELTLKGFNGATDDTDDLILWVAADMTEDQVKELLTREGLLQPDGLVTEVVPLPGDAAMVDPDFRLPDQIAELRQRAETLVAAVASSQSH